MFTVRPGSYRSADAKRKGIVAAHLQIIKGRR